MKLIRPTGTLDTWDAGKLGHVGLAISGTTGDGRYVRLVVDLEPADAIDLACDILATAKRGVADI